MKKTRFPIHRIVINAVMIALYVILSTFLVIPLGGLKLTVEATPVILCAIVFGPVDAAIVGGVAELLNQMLTYGFTPTTVLWILPAVVRGLFVGLCLLPIKKRGSDLRKGYGIILYYIICLVGAVLVSCLNTFTLYVDSKMFGYYSYAMVFGSFLIRILTGLVSTAAMATVCLPVAAALKKAKLVPER